MKQRIKVTYATLRNDNPELHAAYDAALARVRGGLGAHHKNFIDGRERDSSNSFVKRWRRPLTHPCSARCPGTKR